MHDRLRQSCLRTCRSAAVVNASLNRRLVTPAGAVGATSMRPFGTTPSFIQLWSACALGAP